VIGLAAAVVQSPAKPSPSKLLRFLHHAESHLGVANATDYEAALQDKGYRPDIMHLVKDEVLMEVGLSHGDAIRVKAGSIAWWNGPDAKRKHDDTEVTRAHEPDTPPNKKVRYERRYHNGGESTFFGPTLVPGNQRSMKFKLFFKCPVRDMMVPVPKGFMVVEKEEDNPFH
jgi:hypothetical protein